MCGGSKYRKRSCDPKDHQANKEIPLPEILRHMNEHLVQFNSMMNNDMTGVNKQKIFRAKRNADQWGGRGSPLCAGLRGWRHQNLMVITFIAFESSPKRCPIDDSRPSHLNLEPRLDFGEMRVEKNSMLL